MKISIFNLIQGADDTGLNALHQSIRKHYQEKNPEADISFFNMTEETIKNCIGCWDCWVKTPGRCVHKDIMERHYTHLINADNTVFLLDTHQGFLSGNTKTFIDRLIPLYHPYIRIEAGEMNHYPRYENHPVRDYFWDNTHLSPSENQLIEDYLFRCNHHFKVDGDRLFLDKDGGLKAYPLMFREPKNDLPIQSLILPKSEASSRIILYNGSPRGKKGNSLILLDQVILGLKQEGITDDQIEVRHLYETKNHDKWAKAFHQDQRHFFLFPLYVHAMPGIVMQFFEKLTPSTDGKIQMTYFIQSGFSEAYQSFYLRPILAHMTKRLNCLYGGTGIKGGMEGIQIKTDKMNQKTFSQFQELGSAYVREGRLPQSLVDSLMQPVHLSSGTKFVFKVLRPTGLVNFYWDMQLKKNNAIADCFARPY
jgi:multimeric flavodoxin WrbA